MGWGGLFHIATEKTTLMRCFIAGIIVTNLLSLDESGAVICKLRMREVRQTNVFASWMAALYDRRAIERIALRIMRLQARRITGKSGRLLNKGNV